MSRPVRPVLGAVAAALILALTALLPPAAVAQPSPPTEQQIFAQLGVDSVPADYVVLVDTSSSMQGERYDRVRATLSPFIAGTSRVDHVAILTFDSTVVTRYVGPGGDPGVALAQLPAVPTGTDTDIGTGISSALDELGRSGASDVGSIVLLTDGKNEPPAGSPYAPEPNEDGPAWTALRDRAAGFGAASRTIRGYSLPLSSEIEGAQLLGRVLPQTTVVSPAGVPNIAEFLDRTKRAVRVEKAKRVLAEDIGRGVVVVWPVEPVIDMQSGRATVDVTLRSQMTRVPLTVSDIGLRVADAPSDVAVLDPVRTPIELKPGQTTTLTVQLSWAPGPEWLFYERTVSLEPMLTVDAGVTSPWSTPLRDAGLDLGVPTAPVDATHTSLMERTVGYWWVLPALAALLVLLAAVHLIRRFLRGNPLVRGRLYVTRVGTVGMGTMTTTDTRTVRLRRGPRPFTVPARNGGRPGHGTVRPVRTANGNEALEITYTPDGSDARRSTSVLQVDQGGAVMISGVEFSLEQPPVAQPTQHA